jgi:lipopolysaccharide assembly outer membrane protein LptD (OstA)
MRFIGLLGFLCLCSVVIFSQEKLSLAEPSADVHLQADQMTRTADLIITMKGNVRANIKGVTVYADEAEYNSVTGELTPKGHVRIRMWDGKSANGEPVIMDTPMPRLPMSQGK